MKKYYPLFVVLGMVLIATSSCFGQTADNPTGDDRSGPEVRILSVLSDDLQAILDGPAQIIDCLQPDGSRQMFHVDKAIWCTVQHHGKVLKNCDIYFEGNAGNSVGWWIFAQGRSIGGKWYYPGKIDFTWENVRIFADFIPPTICSEVNEYLADQAGKGINVITNYTFGAGHLTFNNVEIHNSGNSGLAIAADGFTFNGLTVEDVCKHGAGLRGQGGTTVDGTSLTLRRCGGAIDFHNEGNFYAEDAPDVADLKKLVIEDARSRNKIAGINWNVRIRDYSSIKTVKNDCNTYPGFDCARRPRGLQIDKFNIKNHAQIGFRFGSDTFNTGSPLKISNGTVDGSIYGFSLQQSGVELTNIQIKNYRNMWVSGSPAMAINVAAMYLLPNLHWAQTFDAIEDNYDALNAQYGTDFHPTYSVPGNVRILMRHK